VFRSRNVTPRPALSVAYILFVWNRRPQYLGHGGPLVLVQYGDNYGCGAVGGMRIGRGSRRTRRDCILMPICPQVPHALNLDQFQAAEVGSRQLTAIAMARPCCIR
jgi:hypothetical protein